MNPSVGQLLVVLLAVLMPAAGAVNSSGCITYESLNLTGFGPGNVSFAFPIHPSSNISGLMYLWQIEAPALQRFWDFPGVLHDECKEILFEIATAPFIYGCKDGIPIRPCRQTLCKVEACNIIISSGIDPQFIWMMDCSGRQSDLLPGCPFFVDLDDSDEVCWKHTNDTSWMEKPAAYPSCYQPSSHPIAPAPVAPAHPGVTKEYRLVGTVSSDSSIESGNTTVGVIAHATTSWHTVPAWTIALLCGVFTVSLVPLGCLLRSAVQHPVPRIRAQGWRYHALSLRLLLIAFMLLLVIFTAGLLYAVSVTTISSLVSMLQKESDANANATMQIATYARDQFRTASTQFANQLADQILTQVLQTLRESASGYLHQTVFMQEMTLTQIRQQNTTIDTPEDHQALWAQLYSVVVQNDASTNVLAVTKPNELQLDTYMEVIEGQVVGQRINTSGLFRYYLDKHGGWAVACPAAAAYDITCGWPTYASDVTATLTALRATSSGPVVWSPKLRGNWWTLYFSLVLFVEDTKAGGKIATAGTGDGWFAVERGSETSALSDYLLAAIGVTCDAQHPCKNNGTCMALVHGVLGCLCPERFAGHHCETEVPASDACPSGWLRFNASCYLFNTTAVPRSRAPEVCRGSDPRATLFMAETADEWQIHHFIVGDPLADAWIGGRYVQGAGIQAGEPPADGTALVATGNESTSPYWDCFEYSPSSTPCMHRTHTAKPSYITVGCNNRYSCSRPLPVICELTMARYAYPESVLHELQQRRMYIIDESGMLWGSSHGQAVAMAKSAVQTAPVAYVSPLAAVKSADVVVRASADFIDERVAAGRANELAAVMHELEIGGVPMFLKSDVMDIGYDLRLRYVLLVPRAEFMEKIDNTDAQLQADLAKQWAAVSASIEEVNASADRRIGKSKQAQLWIVLAVLLCAAVWATAANYAISRPLVRLVLDFARVAAMDLDFDPQPHSVFSEVVTLYTSFRRTVAMLTLYKQYMPETLFDAANAICSSPAAGLGGANPISTGSFTAQLLNPTDPNAKLPQSGTHMTASSSKGESSAIHESLVPLSPSEVNRAVSAEQADDDESVVSSPRSSRRSVDHNPASQQPPSRPRSQNSQASHRNAAPAPGHHGRDKDCNQSAVGAVSRVAMTLQRRSVTLMAADIVGFAARATTLATEQVAALHFAYARTVHSAVRATKGVLVTLSGDQVLAAWNAVGDLPDHGNFAIRAASALRDAKFETSSAHTGSLSLSLAVAVVSAPQQLVGNVGSEWMRAFTVIGAGPHRVWAVQRRCRVTQKPVLIDDGLNERAMYKWRTRPVDCVPFAAANFLCYEVLGERKALAGDEEWMYELRRRTNEQQEDTGYEKAWQLYSRRQSDRALPLLERYLSVVPNDADAKRLRELLELQAPNPGAHLAAGGGRTSPSTLNQDEEVDEE